MAKVEKYRVYNYVRQSDEEIQSAATETILLEIHNTLYEMRKLAVYAAENELSTKERNLTQARFDELKRDVDSIAAMLSTPESETM